MALRPTPLPVLALVLVLASASLAPQAQAAAPELQRNPVDNAPAAEVPPPAAANGDRAPGALQRFWNWSDQRVRGIFDYVLPDTQENRTFSFSFQPRFGDIVHHEHIRLPMSVTYGLNRRTEIEFGIDPYFGNPFEDGSGEGVANLRGSFKYQWEPRLDTSVRAASGFDIVHPLSSAPYRFNQGVNRYRVFQTFARPSPSNPNLEGFLTLSYDLITPSSADGEIAEDDPQNDFYQIGTGVLYRHKRFVYGLALGFAQTVDGHETTFTTVTPSVIYDVPPKYVFNSPGQWRVGASVEAKRYGDETAFDFKVRVRWNVDFRRVVRDWREARAAARLEQASNR